MNQCPTRDQYLTRNSQKTDHLLVLQPLALRHVLCIRVLFKRVPHYFGHPVALKCPLPISQNHLWHRHPLKRSTKSWPIRPTMNPPSNLSLALTMWEALIGILEISSTEAILVKESSPSIWLTEFSPRLQLPLRIEHARLNHLGYPFLYHQLSWKLLSKYKHRLLQVQTSPDSDFRPLAPHVRRNQKRPWVSYEMRQ